MEPVNANVCFLIPSSSSICPLFLPPPLLILPSPPLSLPVLVLGEHLRVCPQGYTCCTSDMEDNLALLSRREMEGVLKEAGRSLHMSLTGQYKAFDGEFKCS